MNVKESPKNPEKEKSAKKRLSAIGCATRSVLAAIIAVVGTEFVCEIGELFPHEHTTHSFVERDDEGDINAKRWHESANIPTNSVVGILIHAGDNADKNMPLIIALAKELSQKQSIILYLRIDEYMVDTACKQLQKAQMSAAEFNTQQPHDVLVQILTTRYPALLEASNSPAIVIQPTAQETGNSWTEAHSTAIKIEDTPAQILIVPMYSEDTGIRSADAIHRTNMGRDHPMKVYILDFNEKPPMSTLEWMLDHMSLRILQISGIPETPEWLRSIKYNIVGFSHSAVTLNESVKQRTYTLKH